MNTHTSKNGTTIAHHPDRNLAAPRAVNRALNSRTFGLTGPRAAIPAR